MSILEYPKAIYSHEGKFAIVISPDDEEIQWAAWGEDAPVDAVDLPNPLALKVDQDPVVEPVEPEPAPEPVVEPEAAPAEPQA